MLQKLTSLVLSLVMFFSAGPLSSGRSPQKAKAVAQNEFAIAGYELTQLLCKDCYSVLHHTLNKATDQTGLPYVWSVGAFLEAMSDACRLFPRDLRLLTTYTDALTKLLKRYLVKDDTLQTPSGEVSGISYYNASAGNSGDYYYDDNEWVCIQLLEGYRILKRPDLLRAAEKNLEFLWTGWDDVLGGGLYWSAGYTSKNACANAPGAIAFLLAYQLTGNETYLEKGTMIYDWMNAVMREDDLFLDAISADGVNKDHWKAAYNQATMIYAGCLLYEITGNESYYRLTKATVDASLPLMFDVKEDDVSMRLNPIFTAWCIGWLARSYLKFYTVDPAHDPTPMEDLKAVAAKTLDTKDENGLYDPFFCSGGRDDDGKTGLLAQCGVACVLLNVADYDALLRQAS